MENVAKKLKDTIGGLTEILIVAIGLLVVVQVVFGSGGENGSIDIIGNITGVVDSFIGAKALRPCCSTYCYGCARKKRLNNINLDS